MFGIEIDKRSPLPRHYQVKEGLSAAIRSGRLKVGDQLPSETELCRSLGVSRMTVRQALSELEREGRIQREPGKGTFVTRPQTPRRFWTVVSFTEEIRSRGMVPSSEVLEARRLVAPPEIAQALRLGPHAEVYSIERLRLANGDPVAVNRSCVPVSLCPDLLEADLASGSLYEVLQQRYGLRIVRSTRTFEVVTANEREARLLGIEPGESLLLVTGVTFVEDGTPIDYCHEVYKE